MKSLSVTIQIKATEQCFPVVLFDLMYKVVVTFESVDGTLKYDHSKVKALAVIPVGTVENAPHGGSNF